MYSPKSRKSLLTLSIWFIAACIVLTSFFYYNETEQSRPSESVTVSAAKADISNLLANSSFEYDEDRNGKADSCAYDSGSMSVIKNPVTQGKFAQRITASKLAKGRYAAVYQRVKVQAGKSYLYEGKLFVKQKTKLRVQLFLDFFDSQGKWVGENSKSLDAAGGFAAYKLEGVVPKNADRVFALIRLQATAEGGSGIVVADDMALRYVPAAAAKPQQNGAAEKAAPTVDGVDPAGQGDTLTAFLGSNRRKLSVVQGGGRLYILLEGMRLPAAHTIYIDSDNNNETGMRGGDWPDSGMDYKIERNRLWKYDAGSSVWDDRGAAFADLHTASAGFAVYLEDLGLEAPSTMTIGYRGGDGAIVPEAGKPMPVSKTFVPSGRKKGDYTPKEIYDSLDNPYAGWAPSSRGGGYKQPFSLVTANISWRDLEPGKGKMDWAAIEKKYDIDKWTDSGKRVILRVVMDIPGDDPQHMDIPDWLYKELKAEEGYANAKHWYATDSGSGYSPNYESVILIREHARMIRALAARYDRDPRIAFIQIGSLGHFGEFHSSLTDDPFPDVSVTDQYVRPYIDAFRSKQLGMRKPFPIAASNGLGLFNDMFGESDSTKTWLEWTRQGWSGIHDYIGPNDDPDRLQSQSRMPEFWKKAYSGGEFSSNRPAAAHVEDGVILEAAEEIRQSHTSWIGATALAVLGEGDGLTLSEQANADYLLRLMGYRFVPETVNHAGTVKAGQTLPVDMTWSNKGVAPFYYPWQVELALADAEGGLLPSTRSAVNADIRQWLPGKRKVTAVMKVPDQLPAGKYKLLVAIIDPDSGKPGIQLGIEGKRNDGWYELNDLLLHE